MDEIRTLRNSLFSQLDADDSSEAPDERLDPFRRALLVLMYAHLEGFFKDACEEYALLVNKLELPVGEANPSLAAASLHETFKKHRAGPASKADDPHHSFARLVESDAELIVQIRRLDSAVVSLPVSQVVSTDSNLSGRVMRRMLALLGFDPKTFADAEKALSGLLKLRNGIAHGRKVELPRDKDLSALQVRVQQICNDLVVLVYTSARDGAYRAHPES